jgi:hypothetical protein
MESASMPEGRKRPPRASGPSGRSGAHLNPRMPLSASAGQWVAWDASAARAGLSWADWVRELQDGAHPTRALAQPLEGPFPERRLLSASEAQFATWKAKARQAGLSWADWLRRLQDGAL